MNGNSKCHENTSTDKNRDDISAHSTIIVPTSCDDAYKIRENKVPYSETNHVNESLFTLGNGYLGIRGNFEEGYPGSESEKGTFINGFYDEHIIKYPEVGHGQAVRESVMLNVTDAKIIELDVDGEIFNMFNDKAKVGSYSRYLDMKCGLLVREVEWTSPKGKTILIRVETLVPLDLEFKHVFVQQYTVTPISDNIERIVILSGLNGNVSNKPQSKDPRIGAGFSGPVLIPQEFSATTDLSYIRSATITSKHQLVCAMKNVCWYQGEPAESTVSRKDDQINVVFEIKSPKAQSVIRLEKFVAYVTTQKALIQYTVPDLVLKAKEFIDAAVAKTIKELKIDQASTIKNEFKYLFFNITNPTLQQGMRFNSFQLLQFVGRDPYTNIGAKGLSGEGYSGHYFWDTEIYILPYFLYTKPDIARNLLLFRIKTLDQAKIRATEMGGIKRGALYPWRTIHGTECSSYFPAGTAQLHINADIAWALEQYFDATNDIALIIGGGAEMLFETSRFWLEYGSFDRHGNFNINCVTGPDEYTALVNNNYYTNIMVQAALNFTLKIANFLKEKHPETYHHILEKISMDLSEFDEMKKASEGMHLLYDKELGVHAQDDSFLDKKPWDWENTPPSNRPLLLHYHYMVIYKHAVIKQADLILALLLQGESFTLEQKRRNFDYYEPLTTHDSSLSKAVYSCIASEIGYFDKAKNYFAATARMDLDNIAGNSQNGLHTACMAGTWMCVVRGFAGLRIIKGLPCFRPYLPKDWEWYNFHFCFLGSVLLVEVGKDKVVYSCLEGPKFDFNHKVQRVSLVKGERRIFED